MPSTQGDGIGWRHVKKQRSTSSPMSAATSGNNTAECETPHSPRVEGESALVESSAKWTLGRTPFTHCESGVGKLVNGSSED